MERRITFWVFFGLGACSVAAAGPAPSCPCIERLPDGACPELCLTEVGEVRDTEIGRLGCVPKERNQLVEAWVGGAPPDSIVRLYFRRLHNVVEDFYHVEMKAAGGGHYWAVLPRPTGDKPRRKALDYAEPEETRWAQWWRAKEEDRTVKGRDPNGDLDLDRIREQASKGMHERRDWLLESADADLQRWLERQPFEPAELFVALYDGPGRVRLARGRMEVAEVREPDDCFSPIAEERLAELGCPAGDEACLQAGRAENLFVGETALWQEGVGIFHWKCYGVVSRLNLVNVLRPDEVCRACVLALPLWKRAAVPAAIVIIRPIDGPVTPVQP